MGFVVIRAVCKSLTALALATVMPEETVATAQLQIHSGAVHLNNIQESLQLGIGSTGALKSPCSSVPRRLMSCLQQS